MWGGGILNRMRRGSKSRMVHFIKDISTCIADVAAAVYEISSFSEEFVGA